MGVHYQGFFSSSVDAGLIMAVRHRELSIRAVQFHPESIPTMRVDVGHRIIANALRVLTGDG